MALGYLLSPALQVENINGKPLVGGTITVYRHGTTNPYITYKDFTGDRNPADVVLNNKGMAVILADPNLVYDVYCRDADGVEQWSRLNVTVADPIGAGDGRIYNITSDDGSITSTSSVDVQTGVTSFDLSLTNPPDATLTVRHEANKDGTYDTLGTFTATGPNKTITVPKEAYSFRIGNRACFYNDVLNAYLTDKPVFAYEVYSWYEQRRQKQDIYQYMAMKQYWGDNNFYDGTANIQFVRIDVENNKIIMQKCLPEYPGSITGYATWEKTELPLDGGAGVFYVEYGTTTFADAEAAYLAGKTLVCREVGQTVQQTRMDDLYFLIDYLPTAGTYTGHFVFSNISGAVQTNVLLAPSATYTKTMTTLATRQEVMDTLAAEIAPDYHTVVQQHYDDDSFPIPAGTYVTYLDNTSSSVLQYFYKSKVAIERWEEATSDPITAPQKWDKILVAEELGKGVAYVDILQTPFADVLALYNQGKFIVGRYNHDLYRMTDYSEAGGAINRFYFQNISGPVIYTWRVTSDGPSETNNWVTPPSIYYNASIYSIATPYDETRTYSVGDVVSRYDTLYRCNTDISVAEPWTQAHWTQTTVAAELADIRSSMSVDKVFHAVYGTTTFAEITEAVTAGKLLFLTGMPNNSEMVMYLTTYTSPRPSMALFGASTGEYMYMAKIDSGTWSWSSTRMAPMAALANYQKKLTAGSNITIDANNVISATAAPQQQADWNQTDSSAVDYIKNKPDLSVYATTTDLSSGLAAKQDVISDLSTIRSGAAAGATAVQPSDLATVATSGDYDDLSNKPTIPAAQVNSDWNAASGVAEILNKPANLVQDANYVHTDENFTSAEKTKLSGIETGAEVNVQADWNEADSSSDAYIQNKPTIPAAQVNADWNASSGVAEILNKPTFATVATTGDYDDLSNKPTIRNVPVSTSSDATKVLTVDSNGDAAWMSPSYGLFEAVYGQTRYADIVYAVNAHKIVYCRISATGASRMAFLAYIGASNVEFQYYRSLSSHSASNQTDEVYVYTVSSSGWTTTTRLTGIKYAAGTHMTSSFANNTLTFQSVWPDVDQTYDATSTNAQSGTAIAGELANYTPTSGLSTVATSGDYNDLSNTPTIPAAQVNADWDSSSGVSEILNKPTPKTLVAGTGIVITETANSIVISLA